MVEDKFMCRNEYLIKKLSPVDCVKYGEINDPLGLTPHQPFGHLNTAWIQFITGLEDHEELWHFEIPRGAIPEWGYEELKFPIRGFVALDKKIIQREFVFESF